MVAPESGTGEALGSDPLPARSARNAGAGSGEPKTERSAGGVVVRRIDGVVHVLLIRDPYKNWGLPKGHVEAGETAIAAAAREVREETGLTALQLGPEIGVIDWFFRAEGRVVHKFCTFHLIACDVGTPVPERAEGITECVWLPARDAIARVTYENAREIVIEAVRMMDEGGAWPTGWVSGGG